MYTNRIRIHKDMEETREEIMAEFIRRRTEQSLAGKNNGDERVMMECVFDRDFYFSKDLAKKIKIVENKLNGPYGTVHNDEMIFALEDESKTFSMEEWKKLERVQKTIEKRGHVFGFEDIHKLWSMEDVGAAHNKLKHATDVLRIQKLSPMEKLLQAYMLTTDKIYEMEKSDESVSDSRSLYGALTSGRRVCVGYAETLKALIEEGAVDEVKIYRNNVGCSDDGEKLLGYHRNLIAHVKDDKYGVNGYYYLDPTWDSKTAEREDMLNFFMVPISDVPSITKHKVIDYETKLPLDEEREASIVRGSGDNISFYRDPVQKCCFSGECTRPNETMIKDFAKLYPKEALEYQKSARPLTAKQIEQGVDPDKMSGDFFAGKGADWIILDKIVHSGKPLEMDKLKTAIKNVLRSNNDWASEQEIESEASRYIDANIKVMESESTFNVNTAQNAFAKANRELRRESGSQSV